MSDGVLSVELSMDDDGFTTTVTSSANTLNILNQQINTTINSVSQMDGAVSHSAASFAAWNEGFHLIERGFHEIISSAKEFSEQIIHINSDIQKTTLLLQGLSHAQTDAARALEGQNNTKSLLDLGGNSPFSLGQLTDTFVKLKTVGIDPTNGSMKALMDSIAAFGGDDSRLQRAGYAIQEMASRGVISLQNLRRQLGQDIPGAVELMARSMNLTIEQLDKKVQSGTLESGHALNLMLEEFQRTYGGASGVLMETFTGRVSQLTNTLQRLALVAGGTVRPSLEGLFADVSQGGTTNKNGFYAEAINQVRQINDVLKSPEMIASAVTLNNTLKQIATTVGETIRVMIEWRDPILKVTEAIVALGGAWLALKLTNFAISIPISLVQSILGIGSAIATWPAKLAVFNSTAMMAVNTIKLIGITALETVVPDIAIATTGVAGLAAGFAGVLAIISGLAIPVGIGAALVALIEHLSHVRATANVATTAIQRVFQGDITEENEGKARKELDQINHTLSVTQAKIAALKEEQKQGWLQRLFSQTDQFANSGTGNVGGIKGPSENESLSNSGLSAQEKIQEDFYKKVQDMAAQASAAVVNVQAIRLNAIAKNNSDQLISAIEAQSQAAITAYRDNMALVEQGRLEVQNHPGKNGQADADGLNVLDQAAKQAAVVEQQDILKIYDNFINAQQALYNKAQGQARISYGITLDDLKKHRKDMQEELQKGIDDQGTQGDGSLSQDKLNAKALSEANTMVSNYTQKIAELNAELNDTGTASARLNALMAMPGWNSAQVLQVLPLLKRLTTEFDNATDAKKRMEENLKAEHAVDMGLDHANEQLEMFTQRITNPGMTDGTRQVAQLQGELGRQIKLMTENAMQSANDLPTFMSALANLANYSLHAMQAVTNMKGAMTLSEVETLNQQANTAYIGSLDKTTQAHMRAAQNISRVDAAIKNLKQSFHDGGVSAEAYSASMAKLYDDRNKINLTENNKLDAIGAKEAKPSENALNELTAAVAKLHQEINTGSGSVAEWTAKLDAMKGVSASTRAQILGLAAEQAKLTEELTKTRAATQALETLKTNNTTERETQSLTEQQSKTGDIFNQRSRTLEVEKQILAYRVQQNKEVEKVRAESSTSKNPALVQQDVSAAQTQADNNVAVYSTNQLAAAIEKLNEERLKDWKDSHSSAQDQKNDIQGQVAAYNSLITASHISAAQQKEAFTDVAEWAKTKFNEIDRAHRTIVEKLIDDWTNWDKQVKGIIDGVANGFDSVLTNMLEKGKANWRSFADDVVKSIEKMIVKMLIALAIQQALGFFSGGTSNLAGSGAGLFDSSIGFGGVVGHHSGGIVGSEPTFMRNVDLSVFNNANKYHDGGLAGDEIPAILKKGEGVFTEGQMSAMGGGYTELASAITKLTQNLSNQSNNANLRPQNFNANASSSNSGLPGSARAATAPNVTFNLNNQSGTSLTAESTGNPQFNGEQWVIDVVVRNTQKPGPLRTAIGSTR